MATRVLLQSRLSSSRLPGKALLTVAGQPVVALAARRAGNTGLDVVVATSDQPEDDAIADALGEIGVAVFRGSLHDPLRRFYDATRDLADDDLVVRLTGDNVVPDGSFVQQMIDDMHAAGERYIRVAVTDITGLGAEVFSAGLLRQAHRIATDPYDREHVTPWIRRHTADLSVNPPLTGPVKRLRCTIDTLRDFTVAARALRGLPDPLAVPWRVLLDRFVEAGGAVPSPLPGTTANPIGQGPWVLDAAGLGGGIDLAKVARVLDAAAMAGVTHVYTDVTYGDAPARIGQSLAHGLSERLSVVAQVAPLSALPDSASAGWAAAEVEASVYNTLRELQSKSVDALLLPWTAWTSWSGGGAAALLALQEQGRCRVVGVALDDPSQLAAAFADPRIGYVRIPAAWRNSFSDAPAELIITCADSAARGFPRVTSVSLPAVSVEQVEQQAASFAVS
ncbi:spore coat polysaccharide biosynthesis protein SpsF [Branchiibius hedensis]|uniref:Spore coat polysaccharide biosynthesis protein SpsF n=1 Tax=Branchiibius hedensis TaxID=672460 RepID=A0A2Y9C1S7_9MICO|nr:aldo/keto reductase [Branchiibius hedensis]PWJ26051.1 spore coat polysaccharide biosynthesis protein SpsF [Branchiibius hedensis]SSA34863.1 spore coat polysaccharide biosynthesis protein SpsF [Branchiibius hedensis]